MKRSLLKINLAIALASAAMVSCQKDSTSAGTASQISFGLSADNTISAIATNNNTGSIIPLATTAATASSISWTSGVANITQFKLEAKKNGKQIEIVSKNITNVDLFSLSPSLIAASIDTGTYKEIEIRVILTKSTTADIPVKLKGTFTTAGGASVPIEFDYNDDAIIRAEAENVKVDATNDITAKLNFHTNIILSNVVSAELDKATRTNGTIFISSTSNTTLYAKVILNLIRAFESRGFEKHRKV